MGAPAEQAILTKNEFFSIAQELYNPLGTPDLRRDVLQAFNPDTNTWNYAHPNIPTLAGIILHAGRHGGTPFPDAIEPLACRLTENAQQLEKSGSKSAIYYNTLAARLRRTNTSPEESPQ